jgi:hypothetical protein
VEALCEVKYVGLMIILLHVHVCAQLDDWVLCRIYKKSTNAQRTGKERDSSSCVEEVSLLTSVNKTQILLLFHFEAS